MEGSVTLWLPVWLPATRTDWPETGSELVTSSRLGLTCVDGGWLEGRPQVKRHVPTVASAA